MTTSIDPDQGILGLGDELKLCCELIENDDPAAGLAHFLRLSNAAWYRSEPEYWLTFCELTDSWGLADILREDPLTARSYEKPRGYAGDADLLDLMYDHNGVNTSALAQSTERGQVFNSITWNAPEPSSVRWRRNHIAHLIDTTAAASPRVLSIAAGNCRELEVSTRARSGQLGRFVALDQDPISVEKAANTYPGIVEPLVTDALALVRGAYDVGVFDLIYSAGLFDYLSDRAAGRLISTSVSMLAPGGELVVANFTPTPFSIGFMESVMDWKLLYRSEGDLRRIADRALSGDRPHVISTRRDPNGSVAYMSIRPSVGS